MFTENSHISVEFGRKGGYALFSLCKRYDIFMHLKGHRGSSERYPMFIQSTDSGRLRESLGCFGAGGA